MARYLVKEKSFVNGQLVDADEIVEYTPPKGTTVSENLELIKSTSPKPVAAAPAAPGPNAVQMDTLPCE